MADLEDPGPPLFTPPNPPYDGVWIPNYGGPTEDVIRRNSSRPKRPLILYVPALIFTLQYRNYETPRVS